MNDGISSTIYADACFACSLEAGDKLQQQRHKGGKSWKM